MRVFDCFTFYNEFDILELRLEELWNSVDFFVIAEANRTHQNNPKPYFLKDNWDKFKKYESKIRHILVDDMPNSANSWENEMFQRKAIERGLTDLAPDDIVIVADCDEIPRPDAIDMIKVDPNDYDRYKLGIMMSYFKLNYLMVNSQLHCNIMVTRGRVFTDPQTERGYTFPWTQKPTSEIIAITHAGWHFTYFGNTEFAANKIKNFAHAETNTPAILDKLNVDWMIENKVGLLGFDGTEKFEYVQIDDYFPETVQNNLEKYKDKIVPNAVTFVTDIYPWN
jgi:hypothetical protein